MTIPKLNKIEVNPDLFQGNSQMKKAGFGEFCGNQPPTT